MSEPLDPAGQLGPHPDSPATGRPPGTHTVGDASASATGAAAAPSTTSGAATAPAADNQDPTGPGDQPSSPNSGGHAESGVTGSPRAARRRWSRTTLIFAGALTGLVVLALISAAIGQVPTSPAEVAGAFLHRVGLDWGPMPAHPAGYVTLWEVRFPRVVLGMLVGAALATAGALLQGVFANPLAEPGVIGVSAGAAVGAGAVIVAGGAFAAAWSVAAGAFVAGLGTTLLVYLLSRSNGRTEVVTLVLTGVAINAFAGGLISFLLFSASPAARDQIVFWQMGSLNGATWQSVNVVWPLTLIGLAAAIWMAPRLDLLALGESAARHLGVDVERLRRNVIVVVAVLATAGVAFTGIILFVGLIVPHLVRMLVGPGHRVLIPLSAIVGAVVLVAADIGARALVHNADLPLGMITSLVGGPFFFWLLRRTRSRSGGWA
ncbi:FecCD family ABC transporter permease [Nocardia tengchongensis]|uniref:FecCD family ABC transporter permease n=1 Tax=Nocardia tengchongensis TaxID=2055889 RepID=UPI00369A75A1